jgi:hypothetical protein
MSIPLNIGSVVFILEAGFLVVSFGFGFFAGCLL